MHQCSDAVVAVFLLQRCSGSTPRVGKRRHVETPQHHHTTASPAALCTTASLHRAVLHHCTTAHCTSAHPLRHCTAAMMHYRTEASLRCCTTGTLLYTMAPLHQRTATSLLRCIIAPSRRRSTQHRTTAQPHHYIIVASQHRSSAPLQHRIIASSRHCTVAPLHYRTIALSQHRATSPQHHCTIALLHP